MDYILISKDQSEALAHKSYKYIKREWKNGHWVYWYKDKGKNQTGVYQTHKVSTMVPDYNPGRKRHKEYDVEDRKYITNTTKNALKTMGSLTKSKYDKAHREAEAFNKASQDKRAHSSSTAYRKWESKNADAYAKAKREENAAGRNYAATMQQIGRTEEQERNKKFTNRAKKWLKKKAFGLKKKK